MDSRTHISTALTAIRRLVSAHLVDGVSRLDERFGGTNPSDNGRWLRLRDEVKRRPAAVRRYLSTYLVDESPDEATAWDAGMLYGLQLAAGSLGLVSMSRPPQIPADTLRLVNVPRPPQ
jgi:hypothetical protein